MRFQVPRWWRDLLYRSAHVQQISMADLLRIMVRSFLRERFGQEVDEGPAK